jgi:addiction module RelB/DinJ family antitoxin
MFLPIFIFYLGLVQVSTYCWLIITLDIKITNYILCNMKTTTSIKLDQDVKNAASKLADELGLSLSSVVNATLKQFVNERRVVFSAHPEFNERTAKEISLIRKDIEAGKNLVGPFTDVAAMRDYLLK